MKFSKSVENYKVLGKAAPAAYSVLVWLHKCAPWPCNICLYGGQEPSRPVLGFLSYLGVCFPFLGFRYASLFCLNRDACVCPMAPGQAHFFVCSWWGRNGILCRLCPCLGYGANSCWAWGTTHSLMKLILFCPFSVRGKCYSIQCLSDCVFHGEFASHSQAVGEYPGTPGLGTGSKSHLLATTPQI